jgi:DNA mismatch repair protein MutS
VLSLLSRPSPEPSAMLRDGGVIADGYSPSWTSCGIADQRRLFLSTGKRKGTHRIPNLQRRLQHVHGYYIEVTNSQPARCPRLPAPPDAEERRALHHARAQGLRGQGALGARPRARAGKALYDASAETAVHQYGLQKIAAAPGAAGCFDLFFFNFNKKNYCRPVFSNEISIEITGGRHPVVEARIESEHARFIANDCRLSAARQLLLITGPNMGGKVHLHAPGGADRAARTHRLLRAREKRAHRPDRPDLHAHRRLDDLAGGRSTFMVE